MACHLARGGDGDEPGLALGKVGGFDQGMAIARSDEHSQVGVDAAFVLEDDALLVELDDLLAHVLLDAQ